MNFSLVQLLSGGITTNLNSSVRRVKSEGRLDNSLAALGILAKNQLDTRAWCALNIYSAPIQDEVAGLGLLTVMRCLGIAIVKLLSGSEPTIGQDGQSQTDYFVHLDKIIKNDKNKNNEKQKNLNDLLVIGGEQTQGKVNSLASLLKAGDSCVPVESLPNYSNPRSVIAYPTSKLFSKVVLCPALLQESAEIYTRYGKDSGLHCPDLKSLTGMLKALLSKVDSFDRLSLADVLSDDRSYFPLKNNPAAKTKVNLFLRDVLGDLVTFKPQLLDEITLLLMHSKGLCNDTVTGMVTWFVATRERLGPTAWIVAVLIRDLKVMSELNTMVKSFGVLGASGLELLAEMGSILGRGSTVLDVHSDIIGRVDKKVFLRDKVAKISQSELKVALEEIRKYELPMDPKWPDADTHWKKRWAYTKSGSHSKRIERLALGDIVTQKGQVTRREFAEAVERNLIAYGEPSVHAGVSLKLEAPKTRAIYGCDSISYFTFDFLLQPIERDWVGKRVLLKPSRSDALEDYSRWGSQLETYKVMLDYDDFNSQHSIESMQSVFEIFCSGAPPEILDWALKSFSNAYIWGDPANPEGQLSVGTLFSGHRATSFINSVLNAAYLRVLMGRDFWALKSWHTGDDVLITTSRVDLVDTIVRTCLDGRLRINPAKQSIGRVNAEFLRVSFNRERGVGYFSRCVGSLISGNWVQLKLLDELEFVDSILGQCWTIVNRSGVRWLPVLIYSTFKRRVPTLAPYAKELLLGEASFNGSPLRAPSQLEYLELRSHIAVARKRAFRDLPAAATQDYLDNFVDGRILEKIEVTRGQLKRLMLEASYKGETEATKGITVPESEVRRIASVMRYCGGKLRKRRGVLESLFPISFMRGLMDVKLTEAVLVGLGKALEADIMDQAWATRVFPVAAFTNIPYSSARSLGRVVNTVTAFYSTFALSL
jgi:hypothetical protein